MLDRGGGWKDGGKSGNGGKIEYAAGQYGRFMNSGNMELGREGWGVGEEILKGRGGSEDVG